MIHFALGLMSEIDKTPKFVSRVSRISANLNTAHSNDIHRQFDASELSSDLARDPDASLVSQVQLWRFVYAEYIERDPGFALRLRVWAWSPAM